MSERTLFPLVEAPAQMSPIQLPLARDVAWDFEEDQPVFRNGKPLLVTGVEAVKVWAFQALKTARYQHEIWTPEFGCELERLVGQPFASETKRSEAVRYIRECLLVSPYIKEVQVDELSLEGAELSAQVRIQTIYGEEGRIYV